jgi:RNA polymerase sigma factor (sigma-70 family)
MAALDEANLQGDVAAARRGDRDALERVVRAIQDPIDHLAMRMLGHPDDARDASQEVLVRVVTKLDSFRGDSRFMTWVYRVATNALLDTRKALRRRESTFDELGSALDAAVAAWSPQSPPVDRLVLDEAKQVCTQGMLLCLDRPHRLAYILGEILELSGEDAAAVLEITPAAYRKRLSRARGHGGVPRRALRPRQPRRRVPLS